MISFIIDTWVHSILDGQHRLVMRELVECLGLKRAVFGTKDMKHFKIQVLRYDTPPWVLQFLSYQRMVQNEVYVVYSEFHAQLSLARKQLTLANLLKIPTDQKLAFVRDRLKSQGNDSKIITPFVKVSPGRVIILTRTQSRLY